MTIPRRWQPPPVDKKTTLSDWWVFRLASTTIASIFNCKAVNGKDTPESEEDIEMQEVDLDSNDRDTCESVSRPRRSQQGAESNFPTFEYLSLKRTMGLRAPR
ncbi:hypothetical protein KCU65_g8903, partial [Aureobasidium melanogenum]